MDGPSRWLLFAALVVTPFVGAFSLLVRAGERDRVLWRRFRGTLEASGVQLDGDSAFDVWTARGPGDGAPFIVDTETETQRRHNKSTNRTYRVVRLTDPVPFAEASIVTPDAITPADYEGRREIPLDPALAARFRAFAVDPADFARWFTPEARQALIALPDVARVRVRQNSFAILTPDPPTSAESLLNAIGWLCAARFGRAPSAFHAAPPPATLKNPWDAPAFVPLLASFILAFILPIIPGLPGLFSPAACNEGERLEMVWVRRGNGARGNLHCVTKSGSKGETLFVLPYAIFFDLSWASLTALLVARALRSPPPAPAGKPQGVAGSAYRG